MNINLGNFYLIIAQFSFYLINEIENDFSTSVFPDTNTRGVEEISKSVVLIRQLSNSPKLHV